jgi:hypothetical protein
MMMKLFTPQPFAKRSLVPAALVLSVLGLSGCADDGYGFGGVDAYYTTGPWSYSGWYDGYYGPIYDGYWGSDGAFYYRGSGGDRQFRRGSGTHFRHDGPGESGHFQRFEGQGQPAQGMHAPHFPRNGPSRRDGDGNRP